MLTIRQMKKFISQYGSKDDIVFVCVGTPRNIADSIGPRVGTKLKQRGFKNVYGCLEDPIHAANLEQKYYEILDENYGKKIIAIDACISIDMNRQGSILLSNRPLKPGSGVGKKLIRVGHCSINLVVMKVKGHRHTYSDFVNFSDDKFIESFSSIASRHIYKSLLD